MFRRILVPLDGSKLAEQVYPHVARLVNALGSEVALVSVCEPEESEYGAVCRSYVNNESDQLMGIIGKGSAAKIERGVLFGKPAEQIIGYAEENDIDLIVISSHGRSGITPWSLGSTVNKLLHKVGIPLIIVRAKEPPPEELVESSLFERILMPLDGSEKSAVVLPYVLELAQKLKSEVILFQALESGHHVHTIMGLDYIPFKDRDIDSMKAKANDYLNKISEQFAGTKASIRAEIRVGDTAEEIIKCASKTDSKLIALASHVHSAIEAWFYGSVTHKILHASSQSVLLVPSERFKK
jgi:nucleotide-binding universal stress UspA family protein